MALKTIAIIPARAGSTRLPGKNTRDFFGRPLVTHTLDAALATGLFDRVVVSSDDPRVLDIARDAGCRPLVRPPALATSTAKMGEVLLHILDQPDLAAVEEFCLLLATTPLRTAADIAAAHPLLESERAAVVMGVCPYDIHPFFGIWRTADERWERVHKDVTLGPSQFFPPIYADNGALYWCRAEDYKRERRLFSDRLAVYPMPRWKSVDIDTAEDWDLAEFYYRRYVLGEKGADAR